MKTYIVRIKGSSKPIAIKADKFEFYGQTQAIIGFKAKDENVACFPTDAIEGVWLDSAETKPSLP